VFCALLILLSYLYIERRWRPLCCLPAAMEEVGEGRYRTRIDGRLTPELARLRDSFNRMAARLVEADATNRRLNEQLLTLQDQERSELARDLHDEVGPFYSPSTSTPRRPRGGSERGVGPRRRDISSRSRKRSAICSGRSGRCWAGCGRSGAP